MVTFQALNPVLTYLWNLLFLGFKKRMVLGCESGLLVVLSNDRYFLYKSWETEFHLAWSLHSSAKLLVILSVASKFKRSFHHANQNALPSVSMFHSLETLESEICKLNYQSPTSYMATSYIPINGFHTSRYMWNPWTWKNISFFDNLVFICHRPLCMISMLLENVAWFFCFSTVSQINY